VVRVAESHICHRQADMGHPSGESVGIPHLPNAGRYGAPEW
jgi:hypothetical protein